MFIGHYGVALGLKKVAPQTPLWVLVMATTFADLLWPILLLGGIERVEIVKGITQVTPLDFLHYPFSHSLLAAIVWSIAAACVYCWWTKTRRDAWVVGFAVLSHWLLDFLVHRPDLPLGFGVAPRVGLGLWDYPWLTYGLEFGILALGIWLYVQATGARDWIGKVALVAFVLSLSAFYLANVFGPPPPSTTMIAYAGNALWLFVLWAFWIERHRIVRGDTSGSQQHDGITHGDQSFHD